MTKISASASRKSTRSWTVSGMTTTTRAKCLKCSASKQLNFCLEWAVGHLRPTRWAVSRGNSRGASPSLERPGCAILSSFSPLAMRTIWVPWFQPSCSCGTVKTTRASSLKTIAKPQIWWADSAFSRKSGVMSNRTKTKSWTTCLRTLKILWPKLNSWITWWRRFSRRQICRKFSKSDAWARIRTTCSMRLVKCMGWRISPLLTPKDFRRKSREIRCACKDSLMRSIARLASRWAPTINCTRSWTRSTRNTKSLLTVCPCCQVTRKSLALCPFSWPSVLRKSNRGWASLKWSFSKS